MVAAGAIRKAREPPPRLGPDDEEQPRAAHALPARHSGHDVRTFFRPPRPYCAAWQYSARGPDDPGRSISTPRNLPFGGCLCIRPDGMFLAESQPRKRARIMTDKESFADKVRDHATGDSPHAH